VGNILQFAVLTVLESLICYSCISVLIWNTFATPLELYWTIALRCNVRLIKVVISLKYRTTANATFWLLFFGLLGITQ